MDVDMSKEFLNSVLQLSHTFQTSVKLNTLHTLDCALHYLEYNTWPCEITDAECNETELEICSGRSQTPPSCNYKKNE